MAGRGAERAVGGAPALRGGGHDTAFRENAVCGATFGVRREPRGMPRHKMWNDSVWSNLGRSRRPPLLADFRSLGCVRIPRFWSPLCVGSILPYENQFTGLGLLGHRAFVVEDR